MPPSIAQELRQTFHIHALRYEAKHRLTGRQWDQYNQLTEPCQKAYDKETRLFNERFDGRINQEYKKLLDEQTSKTKDYKPGFVQDDLFDRKALLKQADTNVRHRHEQRLASIEEKETQAIETLLKGSARVNQHTDQSKDAFARAAERRSGNERRTRQTGEPINKSSRQHSQGRE